MKEYNIDAGGKRIGRIATEVANILNGKNIPSYAANSVPDVSVNITNCSKLDITGKKMKGKEYERYSGYPGGKKVRSMEEYIKVHGFSGVMRKAIYGMLPSNRLRSVKLNKLNLSE